MWFIDRSIALIPMTLLLLLVVACAQTPPAVHYLPGHPTWEMFPRASSPSAECPGQYRSVIADSEGDLFLGCWGQKTD